MGVQLNSKRCLNSKKSGFSVKALKNEVLTLFFIKIIKSVIKMENIIIKEGTTPEQFFAAWGNAFRICCDEAQQKQKFQEARENQQLMQTCGDAVWALRNQALKWHGSQAELITSMEAFAKRFQTEVIEKGGNIHQAGRRIEIIQEAIEKIKNPVRVIQTSLF